MSEPQKPDRNQMTLDERLRYLLASTESLHDQMNQFIEEGRQQREAYREQQEALGRLEQRESKHRAAIVTAIQAYLDALEEN